MDTSQQRIPSPAAANETAATPEFEPDEESRLLEEAHLEKAHANKIFTGGDYSSAIQGYEKALAVCPAYLEYDVAVLRSNIAACHLKLAEWKQAIESATAALDALDRVDPPMPSGPAVDDVKNTILATGVVSEVDDAVEKRMLALERCGHALQDIYKLRTKALLRRATARHHVGGWASLQGASEDFKALKSPPHQLSSLDQKVVQAALAKLSVELEEAKNKEMAEMMGKLKQFGNGLLKPFGLSTDNFQFTKDDKSGGYSMDFSPNA